MKVRVILIAGKVSSDGRLFEDAILKMLINGYIEINRKSIQSQMRTNTSVMKQLWHKAPPVCCFIQHVGTVKPKEA